MSEQVIICPHCKKEIPLTEAISHPIREQMRIELESDIKEQENKLSQKEADLKQKEKEIIETKKNFDHEVEEKVTAVLTTKTAEIQKKAEENVSSQLNDLQEQLKEKSEKLKTAQDNELSLRKKQRELEEREKNLELETTRKIDEQRKEIEESTAKRISEEHRIKDKEKDQQMESMRKQIEELRRKAEQGSQQLQGEVQELELEEILRAAFPFDSIEPVPKGIRGADVLQKVHNQSGHFCGTILWESKQTKAWSDAWIAKLKDDQREVKAEIAVILTTTLPKGVDAFNQVDGVWITNYKSLMGLTTALRINLIQLSNTKLASVGKGEKMEALYNYLSGVEFRQRIEAIVEAFSTMKQDLDQEKRAMTKIWAKREKQIERVVTSTAGMYGDIQGIVGASLPELKGLELRALTEGEEIE